MLGTHKAWDSRASGPESTLTFADEKIGKMGGSDLSIPRYVVFVLVLAPPKYPEAEDRSAGNGFAVTIWFENERDFGPQRGT